MEYRILGPLEVVDGERALPLGGAKQRALLAFLLLHANEIVSSDRIVDELWGERPPATAAKIIQNYVSRLRKELDAGRDADSSGILLTRGPGYLFRVEPGERDLDRFEVLAAEGREALRAGRADAAVAALRAALALWRGSPLADLAEQPFAQVWIGRLEESRLQALEDRIEADLALGAADLVGQLETIVRTHPLRERPRGLLMLALYRSGRQAEALSVYQETRRTLVDELGIEPGPKLQALHTAILRQDASLDLPEGVTSVPADGAGEGTPRSARRTRLLASAAALALAGATAAAVVALTASEGGRVPVAGNSVGVIDPASGRVTATIPVGRHPTSLAVGEGAVWVLNGDDQTISRIDPASRAVKTFAIGATPGDLAVGAGAVWVSSPLDGTISRVDPRTGVVTAATKLPRRERVSAGYGATSAGTTIGVARDAVWVVNPDLTVSRLDPETGSIILTVRSLAANTLTVGLGAVWVVNRDGTLARIDPKTSAVTKKVEIPSVSMAAIAADEGALWVTDPVGGNLLRIDPRGPRIVMTTVPLSVGAAGIAVGEGAVWVSNGIDRTLTRIDPATNRVTRTLRLDTSPLGVAAGAGAAWLTVGEEAGERSPSGAQALPASSCDEVFYDGPGQPRFLIASDLPLQGGSRPRTLAIVEAIKLVLEQRKFRAGKYAVGYQSCDDSTAQAQGFEYEKCASNAHDYAENERVVGVIGPYNSDCSSIAIPIANGAPDGPLALISPSSSATGLTKFAPAQPRGQLARLYPSGTRNFARVYPPDDVQAAALAVFARDRGLRRVFVLRDAGGTGYAHDFSAFFAAAARKLRLEVAGERPWDPRASGYRALGRSIRAARADAVILAGHPQSNGRRLVEDLRAELGGDVELLAGESFTRVREALRELGPAGAGIYATTGILPVAELPERGRAFLALFRATKPGWLTEDFHWVPYAAEAADVLLDAIARSDGTRASVTEELLTAQVQEGFLGPLRFDANGDSMLRATTILRLGAAGRGISALDVDFAEGGTVERVVTPSPSLIE